MRALPAANNENFVLPSKQSVHQRHKSTGNLRGQVHPAPSTAPLQVVARRAVFADKSNTTRANIPYNDSKMSTAKFQVSKAKENSGNSCLPQKDAFKRPAQRPSSKGASLLPSSTNGDYIMPLASVESQAPPASTKPTLTNRAAAFVYNDKSRPATSDSGFVNTTQENHSNASFTRKPRHHQSQPALKSTQQKQQKAISILDTEIKNLVNWEPLTAEKSASEDEVTESPYLDAVEELSPEQFPVLPSSRHEATLPVHLADQEFQYNPSAQDLDYRELCAVSAADLLDHSDHEDEDFYDPDQGYTTAHSYRSGGDTRLPDVGELTEAEPEPSMTVTVMDVPKFSEQALDEIEAAREHVEKHRSAEEVEDELWDISMVAEYGDEIFEYMKEMEVSTYGRCGVE